MRGVIATVEGATVWEDIAGRRTMVDVKVTVVGVGWRLEVEHVPATDGLVPSRTVDVIEVDGRLSLEPVE